jgi:hypothetical protein
MDTINRIKKIYNRYGLDYNKEKVYLVVKKEGYDFYIDNESIIFDGELVTTYKAGSLLVEIANLGFSDDKNMNARTYIDELFEKYKKTFHKPCKQHYVQFYHELNIKFSKVISISIVQEFYFFIEENNTLESYNYEKFYDSMALKISSAQQNAKDQGWCIPDIVFTSEIFRNDKNKTVLAHTDLSLAGLAYLDAHYTLDKGCAIKQCEICKHFFIPVTRTSEKRCIKHRKPNIEDVSKDEFYLYYRKKYRTMKAREDRSPLGRIPYNSRYTEPWIEHIQKNIDKYRLEGDFKGFKKFVDEAMNKYKPNNGGE